MSGDGGYRKRNNTRAKVVPEKKGQESPGLGACTMRVGGTRPGALCPGMVIMTSW